jgi:signal transduction histidine kinase/streptogramin lyase
MFLPPFCFRWLTRGAVVAILASSGARAGPVYSARTWTTDDGLPHNTVTRAVQDHLGFLWFGTPAGLARFDGHEFRQVNVGLESPQVVSNIRGLAEELPGVLLVLTSPNNLLRIADGRVSAHPNSIHIPKLGQEPLDLYVEPSGAIWLATASGALLRCTSEGTAELFGLDTPVAARTKRFTFATDGDGTTWVASDDYLAAYSDGRLNRHPGTPEGPMLIAPSHSGAVWICTGDALLSMRQRRIALESDSVPWKGDLSSVRHLAELRQGDLAVTGRGCIIRYRNGRFASSPTPFALASYILEDTEENLWIGTNGSGAAQIREQSHRVFNEASGLRPDSVSALAEDRDGRVWVANRSGGLYRLDPLSEQADRCAEARDLSPVESVAVTPAGVVWFGGRDIGLWRFIPGEDGNAHRVPAPASGVNALLPTRSDAVWFATLHGAVGRYRDDRLEPFGEQDQHPLGTVYAMVEDRDGGVWLGGRHGMLARWDGNDFKHFAANEIPGTIHALIVDSSGLLWIGTSGGLVLREADRFHRLSTRHGLPDDIIYNLLEDDDGRLWLGTRRGLFHVPRSELVSAARGSLSQVTASRFGPEHGLRGFSPTPNYFPGALKSAAGQLWFASTQGVVAIDPARLPRNLGPPSLLVDEVRCDGAVVAMPRTDGGTTSVLFETLRFPSGSHRLEVQFAVLSFTMPEGVLVRHRLVGVDRDWVDTGSERTASYTQLAPGAYELHAIARNSAGTWSEDRAVLTFEITPAWWETGTFRIAAALLLAAGVAWLARTISQRRLQAKLQRLEYERALEQERQRIARDLHDDFGASLTEVGLLADRLVRSAPSELEGELSGLALRTRHLTAELSSIVWTMSDKNSSLDRLAQFLRTHVERLFRNSGTVCVVRGVETIPAVPLAPGAQHQLLAVAKEAVNNIRKHARATEVLIQMRHEHGGFEATIRDNGVGFVTGPNVVFEGNGVRNMAARLEEIGGAFAISSEPARGTVVTIRFPC